MSCIAEILKLKGDKEVMLPLNSEGEIWVAVEGGGTYKNYEYLIVLNHNGFRCGYVAVPPDHKEAVKAGDKINTYTKKEELKYMEMDIDCHGGLTFGGKDHGLKKLLTQSCDDYWIGFDCGHAFDHTDIESYIKYFGDYKAKEKESFFDAMNTHYGFEEEGIRDYSYVEKQCKYIIDQLIGKES